MSLVIAHCDLDVEQCTHDRPVILVMGRCMFCGHCAADLPEVLNHATLRCDGERVTIEQRDFGKIHACGEESWTEEAVTELLNLGASDPFDANHMVTVDL